MTMNYCSSLSLLLIGSACAVIFYANKHKVSHVTLTVSSQIINKIVYLQLIRLIISGIIEIILVSW